MFEDLVRKAQEEKARNEKKRQEENKTMAEGGKKHARHDFPEIKKKMGEAAARGLHRCYFAKSSISQYVANEWERHFINAYLECLRDLINNPNITVRAATDPPDNLTSGIFIIWG